LPKNIPISSSQNIPLALLGQLGEGCCTKRRRYTRAQEIEKLAADKYNKNGKGITFNDLLSAGIASHKEEAQITLKHCLERQVLFTISNHKPQEYYPTSLRAEILKNKLSKNLPIGVTGVGLSNISHSSINSTNSDNKNTDVCSDSVIIRSLEGYVLPLLPSAPLHIHKMQFKLKITPECYAELGNLSIDSRNKGKEHVEIIGNVRVSYRFYANGTVMVFTESSNNPFKLEDQTDLSTLIAFFGQVRDRLVTFLADIHERIVPGILEWELTQCDINKDIKVSEALQYTGIKVQVKHFDRLFRVYIKSIGKDTTCRVEQSLNLKKKPAVQAINEILPNPNDRKQHQSSVDNTIKITEIHDMVKNLVDLYKHSSRSAIIGHELVEGRGS
jgi:hypothetical protein